MWSHTTNVLACPQISDWVSSGECFPYAQGNHKCQADTCEQRPGGELRELQRFSGESGFKPKTYPDARPAYHHAANDEHCAVYDGGRCANKPRFDHVSGSTEGKHVSGITDAKYKAQGHVEGRTKRWSVQQQDEAHNLDAGTNYHWQLATPEPVRTPGQNEAPGCQPQPQQG
jgi:hypothetical protein